MSFAPRFDLLNDEKSDRFGSDLLFEGQLKERYGRMDKYSSRLVPQEIDEGAHRACRLVLLHVAFQKFFKPPKSLNAIYSIGWKNSIPNVNIKQPKC